MQTGVLYTIDLCRGDSGMAIGGLCIGGTGLGRLTDMLMADGVVEYGFSTSYLWEMVIPTVSAGVNWMDTVGDCGVFAGRCDML